MSSLFATKIPPPKPPATMPDPESVEAKRAKRALVPAGGKASTRLAPNGGTLGREYTRGTLG